MTKLTVLIPGGFKPPHVGHYKFFMHYITNPHVSEVRIFCGDRLREAGQDFEVSLEQAEAVLEAYGILKHPKVIYQRAKPRKGARGAYTNPFADVYDWAEENHEESENKICLGVSSKDEGYQAGFVNHFREVTSKIIQVPSLYEQEEFISATEFREALSQHKSIERFIPSHVKEEQIRKIFTN